MRFQDRILEIINCIRLLAAWIIVWIQKSEIRNIVIEDIEHWNKCEKLCLPNRYDAFSILLLRYKEYRNLLHYRIRGGSLLPEIAVPSYELIVSVSWRNRA